MFFTACQTNEKSVQPEENTEISSSIDVDETEKVFNPDDDSPELNPSESISEGFFF